MRTGTWLCPQDQDRARLLENSYRDTRARRIVAAAVAASTLCLAPVSSWWLLALLALFVVNVETVETRMRASDRPEYQAAVGILGNLVIVATAVALTGGPTSPLLALMAVPTALAAIRFRTAVVWALAGIAGAATVIAAVAADPGRALAHPAPLAVALSVTVGVCAVVQALTGAELHHRYTAILDPLTGLLNRQGLEGRFEELAEQARATGAPVSLLVCDLDHFKSVNDAHGHTTGDAVLRELAALLRAQLRAFELIYRIGGEEFLVVLPGANAADAQTLGQRLCEATRRARPHGLSLTLSVGVSTRWGREAQFRPLFDAADAALYQAKALGRDRVVAAPARHRARHERAGERDAARERLTAEAV